MSTFRRIMLSGGLDIDIDSLPETQKIYYTATFKTKPSADSLGVVIVNKWNSRTKEGIIVCENTITTLGDSAFKYCSNLTSVTIPDSVITIEDEAFYSCANLTSVNIPDSVTSIGEYAYAYCRSLTSITIPDSVETIEMWAFHYCTSLTSVYCKATTPPALGSGVFTDNRKGRKIYVPVESVGAYKSSDGWSQYASYIVGYDFENGVVVDVPLNNEIWYTSSKGNIIDPHITNVFGANITSNTYTDDKGIITFDGDVTTIGEYAFNGCSTMTSITIPNSVTTIEDSAFTACTLLAEFKGKFATEDGRSLIVDNTLISYANASGTTYTIPDSVTSIGYHAFQTCDNLTSVTIPDSVTSIGASAFRYCDSLTEFNGKFATEDGRCLIIDGVLTFFAPYGLTEYTIPHSVTTIGDYAFTDCESLTSVTIPDGVTTIGYRAFDSCTSLTSVNIPDSVTSIGEWAFYSCDNLTSVTIPNSVTTIGRSTFSYCSSLTSVTISDGLTTIGDLAFYECYSLTSITIPDSVTTIGEYAFEGCSSLTSVTIPASITTIENNTFNGCRSLTNIIIPNSVTSIGLYAFEDCLNLTNVNIPDSVTKIGYAAFRNCDSLTSITIPNSVTTIGYYAFKNCDNLTSVYCKAITPPSLDGSTVFDDNYSDRKIYVPTESVDTYKSATYWSEYADAIVGYDFENNTVIE